MNLQLSTPQPQSVDPGLLPQSIAELRPYVGVADNEDVDVSSHLNSVFKQLSQITNTLVLVAIEKRTAADFTASALQVFNAYVRTLRAKSDFLQVFLNNDVLAIPSLVERSLNGLEFDFKEHGTKQFGPALTEQAEFTIWTRRKTAHLVWKLLDPDIINRPHSSEALETGKKLSSEFAVATAWSQFHIDCLTTAMHMKRGVYPDVIPAIVEGLRCEVNAFAIAKQMIDLYLPPAAEEHLEPYAWSADDEELLTSSMEDMESEELEKY
jgi:hypothetical protein